MKKLVTFQKNILIGGLIAIICVVGGSLYYLKSMKVEYGSININKMIKKDKIYSYSVFNDFYFHVKSFDKDGKMISDYSQIVPTETDIGYDFEKKPIELTMKSRKRDGNIYLIDKKSAKNHKLIDYLVDFSKEYGRLVAMQDQHYFDEAYNNTQNIVKRLYGKDAELHHVNIDEFYEKKISLPVQNISFKPFKIDTILSNLKEYNVCKEKWCPNLVEWKFGDDDRIYFQYLTRVQSIDLDEYLHNNKPKDCSIIKTTKVVNNKIQKYFFRKYNNKNEIESFFMDNNGYVYILKYRSKSLKSYQHYLQDYLKIAFGISFQDVKNFRNTFVAEQKGIVSEYQSFRNEENRLNEILEDYGLLKHFHLTKYIDDKNIPWDIKLKNYLSNKKQLHDNIVIKQLIEKANDRKYKCSSAFFGKCHLKEMCNNIQCVKEIIKGE